VGAAIVVNGCKLAYHPRARVAALLACGFGIAEFIIELASAYHSPFSWDWIVAQHTALFLGTVAIHALLLIGCLATMINLSSLRAKFVG
jgi:hypothetical protein